MVCTDTFVQNKLYFKVFEKINSKHAANTHGFMKQYFIIFCDKKRKPKIKFASGECCNLTNLFQKNIYRDRWLTSQLQ